MTDEPEERGDPIHIPEPVGWGCLLIVAAMIFLMRGCF